MSERRVLSHQTLAHQLKFVHELCKQIPGLGEILGFSECLEIDTELAHSPDTQGAAGAIQLVGHPRQSTCVTLLERVRPLAMGQKK